MYLGSIEHTHFVAHSVQVVQAQDAHVWIRAGPCCREHAQGVTHAVGELHACMHTELCTGSSTRPVTHSNSNTLR